MAAEAPITDILCEAMEYLSKLGTNLRKRSENLKEKRISKSKLKNTHAVQKAASKVLLICELSKKSLDNVESGIRKVLSLVDASQESTAISGNDTDTKNETNYHYFRYKSRRLRIVQKIPLKHYTSVKVIANKMPSSLQEKYPVYYDCKLKRQRLIKRRKYKVKRKKSPNSLSDKKVGDTHSESSNDELKDNSLTDKTTREESDGKKENNKTNYNNSDSENEVMDTNNDNIDKTNNKCIENIGDIENCSQDKNEDNNQSIIEISDTPQKSTDIHTSESDGETKRGCVNETKLKIRFADVYSDSNDETHTKKSKANFNNDDNNVDDSSNTETNVRKLKVTESDHNSQSSTVSESATPEIQNLNETGAENDCEQKCESPTTVKSIDDQNDLSGGTKPLIRCVNLSKLLKPNVIDKNMLNDNIEDVKKADVISKKKVRDFEKYNSCNVVKKTLKDDDDKYLSQKKKEVAEFKAKDFSINIMQLPAFTKSFLIKHSLKKILKKGDVICELSPANNALTSSKIKAVKNALLYDSESDEKIESNKVKKSLLEDSDSENNVSDKERNKVPFDSVKSKEQDKIHDKDRRESLHHDSNPEECEKEVTVETSNTVMETDETEIEPTNVCENIDRQGTPVPMEQNCKSQESGSDTNTKKNVESYEQTNLITPTKSHKAKFSLLNDSSDEKCDKNTEETPTKRNAKSKSSLLKDSSAEEFAGFDFEEQEESINKTVPKVKSKSTDSHDVDMDTQEITKEKRKILKSKRKHSRKTREEKRSHHNSTSSDSEEEKIISRRSRKKSRISSSSSEDIKKKTSRIKSQTLDSDTSNSDKNKEETIGQVDGAVDEQSDSSVDKMVRSKAKPSGSSSLNSDNQDASDKVIDGLTNLNSLNKNRQHGTSLKENKDTDSMRRSSRAKKTPLLGEELLKAEPSDDSSSNASNDDENNLEDLPAVTIPGLNGDSVAEHLAKDDLLGETDSDNGQSEEEDNDSDEDNVKSKRRKQNTKSSDSDGGTNSKKRTDDKLSDFEDSEDESSEPIKKSKRKKKGSDSDASVDSNEGGVKSKGRKQNTISSDSDGGTNRKKRTNDKLSDFEDSEDESSEPIKKSKRKKKGSDSDASVDSNEGGQKKRRRIKTLNDSDASGSDTENEGKNKHGRKNIRKVMGKNQLEEATKKAAREEKERIARIAERQKMYNNLDFDESGKPDEVVLEKVVLDFDPETKEPLIQVDRGLVKMLKPHQANGIKFMWDACFESVKRIKKDKGSGCILAHCMGLGKTLQVISLTHTLFTHSDLTGVNRVLVVCPLSTVLNWVNEFNMWLKHAEAEFDVDVYELSRFKQNSERAYQLQQWFDGGGVCVLGYEMFRNLSADNPKKFKKKMLKSFQESLVDPGPDLVICDEGHLLKNEKTSLSQSMNRVKTLRRIVLTGTPLQNNLKEYYCMVQFVKPNLLGKYSEYLNRFVNPITNGQYTDSNEHDIRIMKRRSHVLHKMLDGAVQRRDYGVLAPFLPPKHEYVLFITLTDVQIKLYRHYLENYSRQPSSGRTGFLFPDFQSLQRIWTHPLVLKYNSERYEIMQQKKRDKEEEDSDGSQGSLADFINDDSTPEETTTEESTDDSSDGSDDSRKKKKKKSNKKDTKASTRRGTRANPTLAPVEDDVNKSDDVIEIKNDNPTEWWMKLVDESELDDMRNSHKLVLLFNILRQCENIGDKLLVFSQSLYSLDLIEHFLKEVDDATQEGRIDERLGGHVGSWSPGIDYFRLDGSTSCENRSIWCKNFNRVDNPRARLFLISTRAGGLGINLVAANRVVIFDVSWNPSHDVQSIFRVYRFGQKKPCYVYRFLAMGTMEEKIYERQVTKQAISKRVIDEQQIDRHYAENDLAELYKFEERPSEPRPLPTLPKDRLFAEMLKEHEAEIYKYHEHDSLLENKEEETLSEEERKAAWEDFENEKTRPPPAPFPSTWPMHNGMVPGLLAQQQQQMAIVGLASLLRKDMPNITDDQIRNMLPLLMTSPYVMQKANDYLPNMMNPAMMNTMNAAGSVGGTSGLQYEPPWQRQHQQQQQMRLQQLMQHQNQMGAKVYAGGLGSRDPVAMALQQQRAREIMMGGAGSRPRGRPPMQPRVPTPSSQDVVNLDSD